MGTRIANRMSVEGMIVCVVSSKGDFGEGLVADGGLLAEWVRCAAVRCFGIWG